MNVLDSKRESRRNCKSEGCTYDFRANLHAPMPIGTVEMSILLVILASIREQDVRLCRCVRERDASALFAREFLTHPMRSAICQDILQFCARVLAT